MVRLSRELLIQSCPVPKLPPTYQLLAMVPAEVSGLYDGALYNPFRPSPLLFVVILAATHLTQLPKWDHGCDGNQHSLYATGTHKGESSQKFFRIS